MYARSMHRVTLDVLTVAPACLPRSTLGMFNLIFKYNGKIEGFFPQIFFFQ